MKTIEQFTYELSEKQTYGIFVEPVCDAINSTVEFMQRFISVNEVLKPLYS